jgi:hypothetical protein
MARHDATGVTTPRQTVKASPHRHKWMLSHGARLTHLTHGIPTRRPFHPAKWSTRFRAEFWSGIIDPGVPDIVWMSAARQLDLELRLHDIGCATAEQ